MTILGMRRITKNTATPLEIMANVEYEQSLRANAEKNLVCLVLEYPLHVYGKIYGNIR